MIESYRTFRQRTNPEQYCNLLEDEAIPELSFLDEISVKPTRFIMESLHPENGLNAKKFEITTNFDELVTNRMAPELKEIEGLQKHRIEPLKRLKIRNRIKQIKQRIQLLNFRDLIKNIDQEEIEKITTEKISESLKHKFIYVLKIQIFFQ